MKILIVYAVDPEFEPWQKLRKFERISQGEFTIHRTLVGAATLDFLVSGMGPAYAARAMDAVADADHSIYVAAGFAGSLRPELALGDIVVAKSILREATDESASPDAHLVAQAIAAGGKSIARLVSSDRIATTVEEKRRLAQMAEAVDMESFTVISTAQRRKIPSLAIRIISDRHDQALPIDFSAAVDSRGQVAIGSLLRMMAGSPGQISALMKLGRDSKTAAGNLSRFLDAWISSISSAQPRSASEVARGGG